LLGVTVYKDVVHGENDFVLAQEVEVTEVEVEVTEYLRNIYWSKKPAKILNSDPSVYSATS